MSGARAMGWPEEPGKTRAMRPEDKAYVMPLSRALMRSYTTDAHFTAYATPNGRRLKMSSLEHTAVRIDVLVFDVDCDEVHGKGVPAPVQWRAESREKMLALRSAHKGFYYYESRGGMRIIYRQPIPFVLTSPEDARQWRQDYAVTAAYFKRMFDLDVDPACSDWTRLFRLPQATRTPGKGPEDYPTAGDPHFVESLWFEPTEEDLADAQKILPRAFDEKKHVTSFEPCSSDGYGLFYYAMRDRGLLIREFRSGVFVVRCPNEAHHSCGKTGDRSTFLYLPNAGQPLGFLHCLHAHCAHMQARDWLDLFSEHELSAAKSAAGLTR
jgi:hypothetical protein